MAEVVGAELQLESVGSHTARERHHSRVVDEQVDGRLDAGREGAHR
jgi:hypothetical protein